MRLASHLSMSLQRTQEETTSKEFSNWMVFLQQEETERIGKNDFYMAALTAEVRRGWVSDNHRNDIDNEDFILGIDLTNSIGNRKKKKKAKDNEKYLKESKNHWMSFAKITEEKDA